MQGANGNMIGYVEPVRNQPSARSVARKGPLIGSEAGEPRLLPKARLIADIAESSVGAIRNRPQPLSR